MSELAVVVLGYGPKLGSAHRQYLLKVAKFIENHPDVVIVILAGGETHPRSLPGLTEAGVMADYLAQLGITSGVVCETTSITTLENLEFAGAILTHRQVFGPRKVVVFCDSSRALKVHLLARKIWGFSPRLETYDITQDLLKKCFQICIATPADVCAAYIPPLRRLQHLRQKLRIKNL